MAPTTGSRTVKRIAETFHVARNPSFEGARNSQLCGTRHRKEFAWIHLPLFASFLATLWFLAEKCPTDLIGYSLLVHGGVRVSEQVEASGGNES